MVIRGHEAGLWPATHIDNPFPRAMPWAMPWADMNNAFGVSIPGTTKMSKLQCGSLFPLFDRPSAVPRPKSVGRPTHSKRFATKTAQFGCLAWFGSHPFAKPTEEKARAGGRVGRFEGYCRSPARARSVLRLGQVHVDGKWQKFYKNFTLRLARG
jgi:hypothetical protein